MTIPAITFDTGALIALERRKERAMKVFAHARDMGFVVATPNVTVAEFDVGDFEALRGFFPALRVLAI